MQAGELPENHARYLFKQLMSALEYIHELGISHRDLKPENIALVNNDTLKVIDFGLATSDDPCTGGLGTEGYMAPELYSQDEYSGEKVDVFAAGATLFNLLACRPPFTSVR